MVAVTFAAARSGWTGSAGSATSSDPLRLEAVASNRNTAQKHVWRAAIVLLSVDGTSTTEIMAIRHLQIAVPAAHMISKCDTSVL
jgi:hypothetical protein